MINKFKAILYRYRKLIILFISLFLFVIITNDVLSNEIVFYDEMAHAVLVKELRSDSMTFVMKIITNLGNGITLVGISLFLFFFSKNKSKGISVSLNLVLITIINNLLKLLIKRPRPTGFNIINEIGYSFPSGHSMISTAFYGFLMYLAYKNIKNKALRRFVCLFLFVLIILIAISRVYLGVHYASDVIGGFVISISYLMVFITVVPSFLKIINKESK